MYSLFCYEKYLLDHDEFSYWGKYTKTFFAYDTYGFYFNNYLNTQDILIKLKPETLRVHFDLAVQAKYHEPINLYFNILI